MTIDIEHDKEFARLIDFLFSFDFSCKDIIWNQIKTAIIDRQQSEYHVAFRFFVDTTQECLPASFCGIPVTVEVRNGKDLTMCELFVSRRYIVEYRLYNINGTRLNMDSFWEGVPYYEKVH